ncbi:MAG TPA: iron-sulfur cluster assembly protein, partial [Rhodocyclaceae bacterium]
MSVNEQEIHNALKEVIDPNTGKDLVTGKAAKNIKVDGGNVSLDIEFGYPAKSQMDAIRQAVIDRLKKVAGVSNVSANVTQKIVAHT